MHVSPVAGEQVLCENVYGIGWLLILLEDTNGVVDKAFRGGVNPVRVGEVCIRMSYPGIG